METIDVVDLDFQLVRVMHGGVDVARAMTSFPVPCLS